MKILLTGGSGLLGRHLIPLLKDRGFTVCAPDHSNLDIITFIHPLPESVDLIIHCAGYTDVDRAEKEKVRCFEANAIGTWNLIKRNRQIPFVYISSEFAQNPVNFYSYTKFTGEEIVKNMAEKYLIIRTLFKSRPFTHPKAFIDQFTRGDYVDVIAPLIVKCIFDEGFMGEIYAPFVHVGTRRKTMFDLAKQTKPDVLPMSIKEMEVARPADYE